MSVLLRGEKIVTGMYREGSLERDLAIWAFRFGCVMFVEANNLSAETFKASL